MTRMDTTTNFYFWRCKKEVGCRTIAFQNGDDPQRIFAVDADILGRPEIFQRMQDNCIYRCNLYAENNGSL